MGTIEAFCDAYIRATDWESKLRPQARFADLWPSPDGISHGTEDFDTPTRPGRGPDFQVLPVGPKNVGAGALRSLVKRGRLMHAFLHHELQAAELFAWAILRFPDAPLALRRAWFGILTDEVRHMSLYERWLRNNGFSPGSFAVRDWFWERIPNSDTVAQFLAAMGLGFEGGNLDHTVRFAERFSRAGDDEGARIMNTIGHEEVGHVKIALKWFVELTPKNAAMTLFESFRDHLPPPLTPTLMKGPTLSIALRSRAGFPPDFLRELAEWNPDSFGS